MRAIKAGEELTCDYGYDPNSQVILIIIAIIIIFYIISVIIIVFAASATLVSSLVGARKGNFVTLVLMQINVCQFGFDEK